MTFVATLISNPAAPALDAALIERACGALPSPQAPIWLDPGVAADIPFSAPPENDNRALAERAREALAGAAVDVVLQQSAGRRKALFLADMDSTMIGQECIDELADYVGLKPRVAAITERAMRPRSNSHRRCASGWRCSRDCRLRWPTRSSPRGSGSRPGRAR